MVAFTTAIFLVSPGYSSAFCRPTGDVSADWSPGPRPSQIHSKPRGERGGLAVLLAGAPADEPAHWRRPEGPPSARSTQPERYRRSDVQPRARRARVVGQNPRYQCTDRAGTSRAARLLRARGRPGRRAAARRAGTSSSTCPEGLLHAPRTSVRPGQAQEVLSQPNGRRPRTEPTSPQAPSLVVLEDHCGPISCCCRGSTATLARTSGPGRTRPITHLVSLTVDLGF
jgi:hypothetical protein